jgi:hypothetical protein
MSLIDVEPARTNLQVRNCSCRNKLLLLQLQLQLPQQSSRLNSESNLLKAAEYSPTDLKAR